MYAKVQHRTAPNDGWLYPKVSEPVPVSAEANLASTDVLQKESYFYWCIMRMAGLNCVSFNPKNGRYYFSWFSFATLYNLTSYTLTSLALLWMVYEHYKNLGKSTTPLHNFDSSLMNYLGNLFWFIHILPLLTFMESSKAAEYRNRWSRLQMKYYKITGNAVKFDLKGKLQKLLIVLITLITLLVVMLSIIANITPPPRDDNDIPNPPPPLDDNWVGKFMTLFLFTSHLLYVALLLGQWRLTVASLEQLAVLLKHDIQNLMVRGKSIKRIPVYEELWFDLSQIVRQTGRTCFLCLGFYLILVFIETTLVSYIVTTFLANWLVRNELNYIGNFVATTNTIILILVIQSLLFIPANGHRATEAVGREFQKALLKMKFATTCEETKCDIDRFLNTIAFNPPIVTLCGSVVLDNSLSASMLSTLVTYMVVLLQFRASSSKNMGGEVTEKKD